jgi:hypothetical protein
MKTSRNSQRARSHSGPGRRTRSGRVPIEAPCLRKAPPTSTQAHDPYDNSIGGPNDYAYGM